MTDKIYALYSHNNKVNGSFTVPFKIYSTLKEAEKMANIYALFNNDAFTIVEHTIINNDSEEKFGYEFVVVRMSYNSDYDEYKVLSVKLSKVEKDLGVTISDDDKSVTLARICLGYDEEKDTYDKIIDKAIEQMKNVVKNRSDLVIKN